MDMQRSDFVRAGSLAELKAKGRLVLHGRHSPILVIYDGGRVFALDNRTRRSAPAIPWPRAPSTSAAPPGRCRPAACPTSVPSS
jgi:hypothetical protein